MPLFALTVLVPGTPLGETRFVPFAVILVAWLLLVALTVGPIFAAQKNEGESGWTWIIAAVLLGPLTGLGYYVSRYAMRKVERRNAAAEPERV